MNKEREPRRSRLTLQEVTRLAQEVILREGAHLPTVIAEGSEQTVIAHIAHLAGTHEERTQQLFTVGFMLAQSNLVGRLEQVFLVAEGWLSEAEEGRLPPYPPSRDPRRKEILFVSSLTVRDRQAGLALFEMLRDRQGDLTELREYQPSSDPITVESPLLVAFVAGFDAGTEGPSSVFPAGNGPEA